MKLATTTSGVFALALIALTPVRGEAIKLKPTWTVGKVYLQTQEIDMTMTIPTVGEQKTQMTMDTSMSVTADGEDKVVTMVIESMAMKIEMGEVKMAYDSKDEDSAGSPLAAMGAMIGEKFVLVYDGEDNFKSVRSFPKLEALGEANPFGNEEAVKNLIGESMRAAFPDKEVAPGEAWKHDLEMDLVKMGKMKVAMDFKYEANEEREGASQAKVKFSGVFTGTMENEAAPGMKIEFVEGSKQEGVMYFDPARGVVTHMEADATMNMQVGESKMPMKQKIVQRLTAIKDIAE